MKEEKELKRIYDRERYQKNKELIKAKSREYYSNNKDSVKARSKAYYNDNREEVIRRTSEYNMSKKDGYTYVYYLPEEHYVGITNNAYRRMIQHESEGMFTNNHEILGVYKCELDAIVAEARMHSIGYNGSRRSKYLANRKKLLKSKQYA